MSTLLGRSIYERRMKLGQTQQEAADAIGVPRNSVARWEQGKGKPHPDNAQALAEWLDRPVEHVVAWSRNEQPAGFTDADIYAWQQRMDVMLREMTVNNQELHEEVRRLSKRQVELEKMVSDLRLALDETLKQRLPRRPGGDARPGR